MASKQFILPGALAWHDYATACNDSRRTSLDELSKLPGNNQQQYKT